MKLFAAAAFALVALSSSAETLFSGPISSWKKVPKSKVMRFVPSPESYARGGEIILEFEAGWKNVVKQRPTYAWSGVIATCTAVDKKGNKVFIITSNMGAGTRSRQKWQMKGVLPENSTNLIFELGIKVAEGEIDLGDAKIEMLPCDRSMRIKDFKFNEWQKTTVDIDFINWYGEPKYEPASIGEKSFAFFKINEPGMTFDRFAPPACKITSNFRLRVTPGEVRDFFFGIYSERGTEGLKHEIGQFKTSGFAGLFRKSLAANMVLSRVKNRRQCGDMGVRRSYTIMPDAIIDWANDGESVPAGTTAMAMLQLDVPADTKPGIYSGDVVFTDKDSAREAARIEVEVLPFTLRKPEPQEYEPIAHIGMYGEKLHYFVNMARWLKRRGFESMLIATHYGSGRLTLTKGPDGKLAIKSFDRLRFAVRAYRESGMRGTLFIHLSDKLEVAVAKALGIKITDGHGEQTNMIPEFETPEFKRHVGEAFEAIKTECEGIPIAVLAMDEPNTTNRFPRAFYEIQRIKEAGIPAALYGDLAAYNAVKPDYMILSDSPDTESYKKVKEDIDRRPGARLYLYGRTGSYHYGFGSMFVGRFNHGWGDYLATGTRGHTAWNFLANAPTDFNSIKHFATWVQLNHFDKDMNFLSTIALEAICEGYLDRCYINTLEERLKDKASSPKAPCVAAKFEKLKQECLNRGSYEDPIRLRANPKPKTDNHFVNEDMDEVRSRIADLIMELE